MSSRSCPDWPDLMEIAPDLQFKHFSVRELELPSEVLVSLGAIPLDEIAICCDSDKYVFNAAHTDPRVVEALRASHWFDLSEWTTTGPRGRL